MTTTSLGFDGTVNERGIAEILALASRPVVADTTSWRVRPVTGSRQVEVAPGSGYAAFIKTTTDQAVSVDVPVAVGARFYLIVARRDYSANSLEFLALLAQETGLGTPVWHPQLRPAGFRDEPGVVVDQALSWAHVNQVDNTVLVWDVREVRSAATRLSGREQMILSSQWPVNAAGGGASGVAGRGKAAVSAVSLTIDVDEPTPVIVTSCFRWAGTANAAGAEFHTINGTQIGPSRRSHNDGYAYIPQTLEFSDRALLLPGVQNVVRLNITAEAAGADRRYADAMTTVYRA